MSDDRTGAAEPGEHPVGQDPSSDRYLNHGATGSGEARTSTAGEMSSAVRDQEPEQGQRDRSGDEREETVAADRYGSLPPRPATPRPAPRPQRPDARPGQGPDARPAQRPEHRPGRPEPRAAKSGRRARLAVKRINLASVFMTSLALSALLGVVLVVAIVVLYGVLQSTGAIGSVNDALAEINIGRLPESGSVLTYAFVLAAVDVVLLTVIATLFAGLYNLVSSFTGGIEVTLVDD